ncbi:hypothetical protein B1759_02445 [Rubrivirga sp. SAORIC476]|uniref:hypothetical protein n=1 Tax=Rubrivirga sp. SAORIC476 TaxID=1961794 RepID=UPI000BA996D8|nr:hypothetical protein [Rubrivirga sp. SAORIC476]PAP80279.1 hypothetical protein B1759_02445 [Rubrivirga sp. SAORIC476]
MRLAGAPLSGAYGRGLGARREHLDSARDAHRAREVARDVLVAALYDAMPTLPPPERRVALRVKRSAFNGRAIHNTDGLPATLADLASAYEQARRDADRAADQADVATRRDERQALDALLHDDRFMAAVDYAGLDLARAVRQYGRVPVADRTETRYAKVETSLYEVATRFSSKANPFFLYGQVSMPPGSPYALAEAARLALSLPHAHVLERHLLATANGEAVDPFVMASPYSVEDGATLRVSVMSGGGLMEVRSVPVSEGLLRMLECLSGPPLRESAAKEALVDAGMAPEAVRSALDTLVRARILTRFLIRDPSRLVDDLEAGGLSAERAARLRAVHGRTGALGDLPLRFDGDRLFGSAVMERASASSQPPAYVTRYASPWIGAGHDEAHARIAADLGTLARVLGALPSVPRTRAALRERLLSDLHGKGRVRYLDVITELRTQPLPALSGSVPPPASAARYREAAGEISPATLAAWTQTLPPPSPLSVTGAVDYASGMFYLTNLWAGGGRFLRRFLPGGWVLEDTTCREPGGALTVSIYDPLQSNLNDAARSSRVGFAVTQRHRSLFEDWILPTDIEMSEQDGEVCLWRASTGQRLRFVHDGLVLSRELALEYRVLLTDYADAFVNPFERPVPLSDAVTYEPGARFGSVCVRRERWAVPRGALPPRLADDSRSATTLAGWLHETIGPDPTAYYYTTTGPRARTAKPRYLDLGSALSAASFLRRVRKLRPTDLVLLSPARPDIEGLLRVDGHPTTSELMVDLTPPAR